MRNLNECKSLILACLISLPALISCDKKDSNKDTGYSVAEAKLRLDYKNYDIKNITWSTQRSFQMATFSAITKSAGTSIAVWYEVNGATATREMDSEDLGTTAPAIIQEAFKATKYSNSALWTIKEIELEKSYNSNSMDSYYEVDLVNVADKTVSAELFFNATTGALLTQKEEVDNNDDNDTDTNNKFVVTAELKAAVEKAVPGAVIIDAEVDDNIIEVDAIITVDTVTKEVELEFTMEYKFVSSEIETKYEYGELPATFKAVKSWFDDAFSLTPPPTTQLEITEGEQSEEDFNVGNYYYGVEFDDLRGIDTEYEIEFFLNKDFEIIAVIVNDVKQP